MSNGTGTLHSVGLKEQKLKKVSWAIITKWKLSKHDRPTKEGHIKATYLIVGVNKF